MHTEYKTVPIGGVAQVKDEGDGIVSAIVSVTGVEDNVKDIIEPGAYSKSLKKRTPKGVWSHAWDQPTSKTLEVEELKPGDPRLPKTLPNGDPWPMDAGAALVKTQFNLGSTRGRDAYSDIQFFGPDQEWSIGYKVPEGGAWTDKKTGIRHITELDWYEYSPVLFGAMPHARTATVKDAQLAFKSLNGEDISGLVARYDSYMEFKSIAEGAPASPAEGGEDAGSDFVGDGPIVDDAEAEDTDDGTDYNEDEEYDDDLEDEEDDEYDDEEDEDEDDEDDEEKSELSLGEVRAAIRSLEAIEQKMHGGKRHMMMDDDGEDMEPDDDEDDEEEQYKSLGMAAYVEAKAVEYDTISDAIDQMTEPMSKSDAMLIQSAGEAFDTAIDGEDLEGAEEAASEILDILENVAADTEDSDSARTVARVLADKMDRLQNGEPEAEVDGEGGDEEDDEEEGGYEDEESKSFVTHDGVEFKNAWMPTRDFGMPVAVNSYDELFGEEKSAAFIGALDSDTLCALGWYLDNHGEDAYMKSVVDAEVEGRIYTGWINPEEKRIVRTAAGAVRYGVPIGSVIGSRHRDAPSAPSEPGKRSGAQHHGVLRRLDGKDKKKAKLQSLSDEDFQAVKKHHTSRNAEARRLNMSGRAHHEELGRLITSEHARRGRAAKKAAAEKPAAKAPATTKKRPPVNPTKREMETDAAARRRASLSEMSDAELEKEAQRSGPRGREAGKLMSQRMEATVEKMKARKAGKKPASTTKKRPMEDFSDASMQRLKRELVNQRSMEKDPAYEGMARGADSNPKYWKQVEDELRHRGMLDDVPHGPSAEEGRELGRHMAQLGEPKKVAVGEIADPKEAEKAIADLDRRIKDHDKAIAASGDRHKGQIQASRAELIKERDRVAEALKRHRAAENDRGVQGAINDRKRDWEPLTPSQRRQKIRDMITQHVEGTGGWDRYARSSTATEGRNNHLIGQIANNTYGVVSEDEVRDLFDEMRHDAIKGGAGQMPSKFGEAKKPAPKLRRHKPSSGFRGRKEDGDLAGSMEFKRSFNTNRLEELGKAGMAFKNGNGEWSYPIENAGDLDNAIKAYGRCMPGDKDRLKSYIRRRANALGKKDMLPESWAQEKVEIIDLTEFKSLESLLSEN